MCYCFLKPLVTLNCGKDKERDHIPDVPQVILNLRKEEELLLAAICSELQLLCTIIHSLRQEKCEYCNT
jgi:hypothetical protein